MTEAISATGELTVTRIFDAPRELVFRCMIEPEHLTHFWGPVGVSTPIDKSKVDRGAGRLQQLARPVREVPHDSRRVNGRLVG